MSHNDKFNNTIVQWPSFGETGYSSFTTSVPGIDTFKWDKTLGRGFAAVDFWLGVTSAVLGIIGTALVCTNWCRPRNIGLVAALYAMFMFIRTVGYLGFQIEVKDVLSFYPFVLLGTLEMPLKYYIMLLDSRVRHAHGPHLTSPQSIHCCVLAWKYWCSLSLTGDNSTLALDTLDNEMVGKVAVSMRTLHAELAQQGTERAPHLHWTRRLIYHYSALHAHIACCAA